MPRTKKTKNTRTKTTATRVTIARPEKTQAADKSLFERLQPDFSDRQSLINLILGSFIVIVLGVLVFNYFNKQSGNIGPAQQTENSEQNATEDVAKENLPGKYTVKEGDTLFTIAQNYYNDGYKYTELIKNNSLADENTIEVGQVLEIPKLGDTQPAAVATPSTSPEAKQETTPDGTGGAENQTAWGEKIAGDTYTVQDGDWLSKISGRAYGDVMAYEKIAQANNISNPDLIEPGITLKIPR